MNRVKKRKRSYFTLKLFLAVIFILVTAVVFFAYYPQMLFAASGGVTDAVSKEQVGHVSDGETINIALLGFDRPASRNEKEGIYRPDTIMIAAINLREAEVKLVNIPRDSYVQIYGTDIYDKINHSYMYGYYRAAEGEDPHKSGIKTTLLTIRNFLGGVPLHGFISVDMGGSADIVDSIGGIYYDVEFDVRSNFGHGRLLVEEGYQLLDGEKFMHYVRNRAGYQGGERGRTERQQQVMIALFDQLKGLEGAIKIPRLYYAVAKNVETELNLPQMGLLGILGLRVNPSQIETSVFSGRGQLSDRNGQNIWYLVIDEQERVEIIEAVFGVTVEKRPQVTLPGPIAPEPEDPEPEPMPELEPEPVEETEPDPEPEEETELEEDPVPEPEPDPADDPEEDPEHEPDPGEESDTDPDPEPEPDLPDNNEEE